MHGLSTIFIIKKTLSREVGRETYLALGIRPEQVKKLMKMIKQYEQIYNSKRVVLLNQVVYKEEYYLKIKIKLKKFPIEITSCLYANR